MRDIKTNEILHLILFRDSLLVCSSSASHRSLWKLEQRWSVDEIEIEPESFENGKDGAIIFTCASFGRRHFRASCILNKLCFLHDLRQTIERAKAAYKFKWGLSPPIHSIKARTSFFWSRIKIIEVSTLARGVLEGVNDFVWSTSIRFRDIRSNWW